MTRVLSVSAFVVAYVGLAWASLWCARDGLGYGVWSAPMAVALGGGLLMMLARACSLLAVALRRPVAADLPQRLRVDGHHNVVAASALACVLVIPLYTLMSRSGLALGLRRWEIGVLGLVGAYLVLVAGVVVLDTRARPSVGRPLAYLAATDPEGWLFASDGTAAQRRQAGRRMAGLWRGALGSGVFMLLYAGGSHGLGLRPAWSLAGAVLVSTVAVTRTSCRVPRRLLPPLEPLEQRPCAVTGVHEWDGATCRQCGARRHRREGQPV